MKTTDEVRREWQARYGRVWCVREVAQEFDILGHTPTQAIAMRKTDKQLGTMIYCPIAKLYADFRAEIEPRG